jgi:hypothetical protein
MDPNLAVEKLLAQGCDVFWFFWIFFSFIIVFSFGYVTNIRCCIGVYLVLLCYREEKLVMMIESLTSFFDSLILMFSCDF